MTTYEAAAHRYDDATGMEYRYTGHSGLKLPVLSLGLWQNFGDDRPEETQRAILRRAFDRGVTHFDLANNYGPPYGRAEENFGRYLGDDFTPYRDELVISTKAGYDMWPRPYGQGGGSRKYVLASLDHFFVCGDHNFMLSEWMKGLKRGISNAFRAGHDPPRWQPGFFDHLLRNDESYAQKWNYVRENPVRAGLVQTPDDWPYQGEIVSIDRCSCSGGCPHPQKLAAGVTTRRRTAGCPHPRNSTCG